MAIFRPLLALTLLLLLPACLSVQPKNNITAAPISDTSPMTPTAKLTPYRLQIGDVIDIKLLSNPELNEQITIPPDGLISTAVVQGIMAYGRTAIELEYTLEQRYAEYLAAPNLAVIIRSFAPNRVYVTGEVNQPGEFISVGPNLTLLQAIARAGGLKPSASPDELIIIRRGSGDKTQILSANYREAASGSNVKGDVRLASYDVVYIPRSDISDVFLHYNQYVRQFVPSSFGLSYQLNSDNR